MFFETRDLAIIRRYFRFPVLRLDLTGINKFLLFSLSVSVSCQGTLHSVAALGTLFII
jgi:hypothetical protein